MSPGNEPFKMIEANFQFENDRQASRYLGDKVSAAFKKLIETMQLGQSLELNLKQLKREAGNDQLRRAAEHALHDSWHVIPTQEDEQRAYLRKLITKNASSPPASVTFMVSEINTTCSVCNEKSHFKLVKAYGLVKGHAGYQVFAFVMQCQSCKAVPEVFIVQRRDM